MSLRLCFSIFVGLLIALVVGVNLLLYGRTLLLRRIGALVGSLTGPGMIWLVGEFLLRLMGHRLWFYFLGDENVLVVGRDITLNELLWIPLQDAEAYVLLAVLFAGLFLFMGRKTSSQLESLFPVDMFDRWLDRDRQTGRRGWIIYQAMTAAAALSAIPAMGLFCYITLQTLLLTGQRLLIKNWIGWSVFIVAMIFALVYYAVNTVIALQDQDKQPQQAE